MKIIAVRIGDRYGPEYETHLESKLPEYEFVWIREPIRDDIVLQWNKMYGMNLDIDEPVCVVDIDVLLVGEYKKVFEYPIKYGILMFGSFVTFLIYPLLSKLFDKITLIDLREENAK